MPINQDNYKPIPHKMHLQIMLEPKLDQISLFEKNLAEHNKKSTLKSDFEEVHGEE